jgi:hypothetical protein
MPPAEEAEALPHGSHPRRARSRRWQLRFPRPRQRQCAVRFGGFGWGRTDGRVETARVTTRSGFWAWASFSSRIFV